MTDILEELRVRAADSTLIPNNAYKRAADEIERLRAENDLLRPIAADFRELIRRLDDDPAAVSDNEDAK